MSTRAKDEPPLGETVERTYMPMAGLQKFIVTQRFWQHDLGISIRVLTPLPEGMEAADQGRRFPGAIVEGSSIPLILHDLNRLRSDEWLEKVAREIAMSVGGIEGWRNQDRIEAILRKHRAGTATQSPAPSAPADEAPPQG